MRLACVLRISGRAAAEAFREVKAPGKRKTWKKQARGSEWNIRVPKGASRSFCQKGGAGSAVCLPNHLHRTGSAHAVHERRYPLRGYSVRLRRFGIAVTVPPA
ncbi:hypothetical protein CLOM621_05939 [Clostridium sp. M62/1]|nr:hypothetical protein CLOM621_05939 [Clostridium sp. M62/1]